MTTVYVDSVELIALPAARRQAEADVEEAAHVADSISAALWPHSSIGAPLQVRQALADLLFEESDVEGEHAPNIGL